VLCEENHDIPADGRWMDPEGLSHLDLLNTLPEQTCNLKASEFSTELAHGIVAPSPTRAAADGVEVGVGLPGLLVHPVRLPYHHRVD
jgi:hypothetical protein